MPGILKVGSTYSVPDTLVEANQAHAVPTPYYLEIAKRVERPKEKETALYKILQKTPPKRGLAPNFFRIDVEKVKDLFELMDGQVWPIEEQRALPSNQKDTENVDIPTKKINVKNNRSSWCRELSQCFYDGQRVRHVIGDSIQIGKYNLDRDSIWFEGNFYSLSGFAGIHYEKVRPDRTKNANGWNECERESSTGEWENIHSLPKDTFPQKPPTPVPLKKTAPRDI